MIPAVSGAEIDFFQTPAEQKPPVTKKSWAGTRGTKIAKILFFIAPGCSACPDEAAKLERELNRIGLKYQIEGVFVGDPRQVGKYLAGIRTYPFKFDLALDLDGKMTREDGVKSFPSAVVDVDGKKFVITKAEELEAKLR
jgi:thiol-disulfide isomerase/thioredoxin